MADGETASKLSCSMLYTLIEHAFSTNDRARYIQTLL